VNPDPDWCHDTHASDGRTTLTLSGEIDMTGAGELRQLPHDAVHGAEVVTVDIAALRFIDSEVIGALVSAHSAATAAGRVFSVVNAAGQVRRVLQATGILDSLTA
jgi:anti-sigma B factor antagonist